MKKSRWILQTLILSAAFNVLMLCIFFYFLIRDNPLHFTCKPAEETYHNPTTTIAALMSRIQDTPFETLVTWLYDESKVEYGYKLRDFALGALVAAHDFDIERAVGRQNLPKKKWVLGQKYCFIFPSISDQDFQKIEAFVKAEKWPFTAKGLFRCIRDSDNLQSCDPSLVDFFCHTPAFVFFETLFSRTGLPMQRNTLLSLALEGGWERLENFYSRQKQATDFSASARQKLLIEYIEAGSSLAAYLILITDPSFAIKQTDDDQMMKILDLLHVKTEESLHFVRAVAASPRKDGVRKNAIAKLAAFTGDNPSDIAGHFYEKPGLKELRPVFRDTPPAAPDPRTHIVQPGESLWLIARRYKISLETLMETNHLQTTVIQPGKTLKIPQ